VKTGGPGVMAVRMRQRVGGGGVADPGAALSARAPSERPRAEQARRQAPAVSAGSAPEN